MKRIDYLKHELLYLNLKRDAIIKDKKRLEKSNKDPGTTVVDLINVNREIKEVKHELKLKELEIE